MTTWTRKKIKSQVNRFKLMLAWHLHHHQELNNNMTE